MNRARSFHQALEAGLEPRDYNNASPLGTFRAHLDFKIWCKLPALRCFFTAEDGLKFSLYANRAKANPRWYSPRDGSLDMSDPDATGKWYELATDLNSKGNIAWLSAMEVPKQA